MYICMCTQGSESPVQATLQGMAGLAQVYVYIQQKEHVQARCSKNKQLASANHRASGSEANRIHGFTTDKAPIRQPAVCIVEKAGTVYHTAHIKGNYAAGDSSCVRVFVASTATVETKISKTHP